MTPKEKAEELVDKFELNCAGIISNSEDWETLAKESALIAVDEILYVLNEIDSIEQWNASYFYNQVKQEINRL